MGRARTAAEVVHRGPFTALNRMYQGCWARAICRFKDAGSFGVGAESQVGPAQQDAIVGLRRSRCDCVLCGR